MGIVAAMIVLVMLQRLLGYYPGLPGWEVAEIAAARKDVSLCKKILDVPWNFVLGFGPSSREMRADCIHDYAKLTKDPSVCELLMPSSYGLSCVGTALGNFESCPLGNNRETEIDGNIVSLKKCIDGNAGVRDSDCCKVAKARFLTGFDDCNISTPGIRDECNYELSFKNNDPGTCASISGAKVKSACEIAAGALQKDPSICVGCIKPVNSVDELGQ
jgi:hypothetical protein